MSRNRNTSYNTVHHLTSRIAHQAFFLKDEQREDFVKLMLRVSAFSGVELLGWCVMSNHFHIYAYLPVPPQLTDEEVLERYHELKGDEVCQIADSHEAVAECQAPCDSSDARYAARAELVRSIRRQMYSVAEFMRMIKQWFSEDYNERNGHKGTMWAEVYGDHPFFFPEMIEDYTDLRDILGYIHLNPIRANMVDRFDGYRWSSYAAFKSGEPVAVAAMRRVYPGMSDAEIAEAHELRMNDLLEKYRRKSADAIARKRLNGYKEPAGHLTDECMIAQSIERIKRIEQEVMQLQLERKLAVNEPERRELICRQILKLAAAYPDSTPQTISAAIEIPVRTAQRYIKKLLRVGTLLRDCDGLRVAA